MTSETTESASRWRSPITYQFGLGALIAAVAVCALMFGVLRNFGILWSVPVLFGSGLFFRKTRKFSACALLLIAGCQTLLTGCPVPLLHVERLQKPIAVQSVTDESLLLADGRAVRLPFISRLPKDNFIFLKSLERGVEVEESGDVIGLLTLRPWCGNDPFISKTQRINLTELVAALDHRCIDDTVVPAELISFIGTYEYAGTKLNDYVTIPMRRAGRILNDFKQTQLSDTGSTAEK